MFWPTSGSCTLCVHVAASSALKLALAWSSAGPWLINRVEIATSLTSLTRLREGLFLLQLGSSPYAGSAYHAAPLLLPLLKSTASQPLLYVIPGMIADTAAACSLALLAGQLTTAGKADSTGLENAAVFGAIAAAVARNPPLAAFCAVSAAYLSLQPVTLLVPLAVLLWKGPEALQTSPVPSKTAKTPSAGSDTSAPQPLSANLQSSNISCSPAGPSQGTYGRRVALQFLAFALLWAAALGMLSDVYLRRCPGHQRIGWLSALGMGAASAQHSKSFSAQHGERSSLLHTPAAAKHWAREVYGYIALVEDNSPNIGIYWYFFTQTFPHFRTAALVFLHSAAFAFTLPLSWRFRHRPLLACLCQLIVNALFKPYPSVADVAQYLALLPWFTAQLQRLPSSLFLANTFLLLAMLGPCMWHLWIHIGSANANFFYAITLLFGAWQVLLLSQLLAATLECDRQQLQRTAKLKGA